MQNYIIILFIKTKSHQNLSISFLLFYIASNNHNKVKATIYSLAILFYTEEE